MKISVIVPIYNAEKFLPVCLESLAIQTFTDFEVIVVDDCSTDSSVAIAESFTEKFCGRLKIISLEKNTGSGAVPRNIGLEHARGKYVYFVDNDDFLIDNALEIFYDAAENFQADVCYTEGYFTFGEEIIPTEVQLADWNTEWTVDEPTLEVDAFVKHVEDFAWMRVRWTPWLKFLRRDFLLDNDIKFPPLRICEDGIWTFKLLCFAKRWLRLPTPLYVYRDHQASWSSSHEDTPQEQLRFWVNPLINGVDYLAEFMKRFDFFQRHQDYGLRVMNVLANESFKQTGKAFDKLPPREIYEIFLQELSTSNGDHSALLAYLIFIANTYRNELVK
ncbi:MAG: glycosyltransferase [Selenomonadaceae bacterium]|nr:glycosyltransferase [Selenomonadaceae bacterium]